MRLMTGGLPIGYSGAPASKALSPKAPVSMPPVRTGFVPAPPQEQPQTAQQSPVGGFDLASLIKSFGGGQSGILGLPSASGVQQGVLPSGAFENLPVMGEPGFENQPAPEMEQPTLSSALSMMGFDPSTGMPTTPFDVNKSTSLGFGPLPAAPSFQSMEPTGFGSIDPRVLMFSQLLGTMGAGVTASDPYSWQHALGTGISNLAGQGLQEQMQSKQLQNAQAQQQFENMLRLRGIESTEKKDELERAFEREKMAQLLAQKGFDNLIEMQKLNRPIPLGDGSYIMGDQYFPPPQKPLSIVDLMRAYMYQQQGESYGRANKPAPKYLPFVDESGNWRYGEVYPGEEPRMLKGEAPKKPSATSSKRQIIYEEDESGNPVPVVVDLETFEKKPVGGKAWKPKQQSVVEQYKELDQYINEKKKKKEEGPWFMGSSLEWTWPWNWSSKNKK